MEPLAGAGALTLLLIVLACLGSVLALTGLLVLLLKLGVIAHYWTKPEPVDESAGHSLAQSREAGQVSPAPKDEA